MPVETGVLSISLNRHQSSPPGMLASGGINAMRVRTEARFSSSPVGGGGVAGRGSDSAMLSLEVGFLSRK